MQKIPGTSVKINHSSGVIVIVVVHDYKMGICCFSAKYATLRSKSKDWLA
jgi:hypothetical protein